ncbi:MAG: hypothetical protein KIT22_20705, partial [Verrucomicrobiae bacterium]|nr:hypothetical protein [Verrucomicrobiae bacterium]
MKRFSQFRGTRLASGAAFCHAVRMPIRRLSVLLLLLLAGVLSGVAWAGPDDDFIEIYQLIRNMDAARGAGRLDEAREGYLQAQKLLQDLKRGYPNWNERVIAYRLRYISEKLELLPAPDPVAPAASPAATPAAGNPAPPAPEGEVLNQLRTLHTEI